MQQDQAQEPLNILGNQDKFAMKDDLGQKQTEKDYIENVKMFYYQYNSIGYPLLYVK